MGVIEQKISNSYQAALDAVFPNFCVRCDQEGELLCVNCRGQVSIELLASKCPFCERVTNTGSVCRRCSTKTELDGCVALAHYAESAVKGLVKHWKYQFNTTAQDQINNWIRSKSLLHHLPNQPWEIVPVSLHAERHRWRGFDQAVDLAETFGYEYDLPVNSCLRRIKRTRSQAQLGQRRRGVGELKDSFKVIGQAPACALLCDDVLTTGATLNAAATALKKVGTEVVWAMVLARGN